MSADPCQVVFSAAKAAGLDPKGDVWTFRFACPVDPSHGRSCTCVIGAEGEARVMCDICLDREVVVLALGLTMRDVAPPPEPPKSAHGDHGPLTITAAAVKSHIIRWLWLGRLAFGYLTVATGLEKIGKSVFWCWAIGQLTNGTLDGGPDGPTDVLIVAREDGIEDMWKPRLALAGADLDRVHFVRFEALGDDWNVRDGIDRLRDAAKATQARLLLLDAVLEHMPEPHGNEGLNSPTFIRRSLRPLIALAGKGDSFAVVASLHPPKRPGTEFRDMVQSSQAWTAVSRLGLLFAYHPDDVELPDDERRRVVVRGAGNIGRNPASLVFHIEGREHKHDDGKTQVREVATDVGPCAVGMRDLARAAMRDGERTETKTGRAVKLIRAALHDGTWHDSAYVYALLDAVDLGAKATVADARKLLGVEVRKSGFEDGWQWRLKSPPLKSAEPSARAHTEAVGHRTFDDSKASKNARNLPLEPNLGPSYEDSPVFTDGRVSWSETAEGSAAPVGRARTRTRDEAISNGAAPDLTNLIDADLHRLDQAELLPPLDRAGGHTFEDKPARVESDDDRDDRDDWRQR